MMSVIRKSLHDKGARNIGMTGVRQAEPALSHIARATAPPRWARWAAHSAALTTLPSGLWRIALALGLPVGYTAQAVRKNFDAPGWGSLYVIGLSILLEAFALLTLGLVQGWGEVVPRWIPFLGGKDVHPMVAVIPAATGALALTLLWLPVAALWWTVGGDGNLSGTAHTVVGILYLPLAAWGPLLAAVTASYYLRHRR